MTSTTFSIAVTGVISAPAAACYQAIANYRTTHPQIVPPKYFGPLTVESGGIGAGTRLTCSLRLLGKSFPFAADVTEPEPRHLLVETIPETGAVTSFAVTPDGESRARVTIETRPRRGPGLAGAIERFVTLRVFPRVYSEELGRLASVVSGALVGDPVVRRTG